MFPIKACQQSPVMFSQMKLPVKSSQSQKYSQRCTSCLVALNKNKDDVHVVFSLNELKEFGISWHSRTLRLASNAIYIGRSNFDELSRYV